ncbi:MAG: MotA/TolQ/ExbB proton channel family protein [Proteobacteria bacterium]|nr:MotA/TolQ/ExbB proton channel family protein [Pseudomonadota bacterium]
MSGMDGFWAQADGVGVAVALTLLLLSIATWVLLLWKSWLLHRARRGMQRGMAAFWQAPTVADAHQRLATLDAEHVLVPLVAAALEAPVRGTLDATGGDQAQRTRRLRDALHAVLTHLRRGQAFLASVGATAPFIGLFGTVWGIYHALLGLAGGGGASIERVAGPVGEALIMTAAGLAVAIPAVLAYNGFNAWLATCEAELEGFAHDLLHLGEDAP